MPIYVFTCSEHGVFDVFQNMNDEHKAVCPICKKEANRIYYPPQLKCKDSNVGYTASELYDNLAKEGHGSKDWRQYAD